MALELPYGYKNLDPAGSSNVDESYGYYNSLAEAYAAVPLAMRKGGRTVGIKQADGKIVEYWWENDNDLSDEGLVEKTSGSGGGGGGDAVWGNITGAIQDQGDLMDEFEKKADKDEIPDEFIPAEHDLDEFKNQSINPFARKDDLPPVFHPDDYDLAEFNNESQDPYARTSDIPPPFDPTYLEDEIADLSQNKQDNLGFTPEDVENKAEALTDPDNVTYPTTKAVADAIYLTDIILSANAVLNVNWNGRDVITAGYSLTVNPTSQDYGHGFEVYLYNNSATDSAIVLNVKAGVTYTVIDNDVSSATVYLQAYGTAVIKRIGNTQNYIVRGYII